MHLDVNVFTYIQNHFLQEFSYLFAMMAKIAVRFLYFFVVFEFVIFGLLFALNHASDLGRLFFQIIKIGLLLFIFQHYVYLLNVLLSSMIKLDSVGFHIKNPELFLLNPTMVWQYGYNAGIGLLKQAVLSSGIGLPLIDIILGFGILCLFSLIGVQVILQLLGFYFVAFMALCMMPLGAFQPTQDFFSSSISAILKSMVRLAVMLPVLSMAFLTWQQFHTNTLSTLVLSQALGLLFSALLFCVLIYKLPSWAAQVVGKINSLRQEGAITVSSHNTGVSEPHYMSSMFHAQSQTTSASVLTLPNAMTSSDTTPISSQTTGPKFESKSSLINPVAVTKKNYHTPISTTSSVSISDKTLNKIRQAFRETLREAYSKNNKPSDL